MRYGEGRGGRREEEEVWRGKEEVWRGELEVGRGEEEVGRGEEEVWRGEEEVWRGELEVGRGEEEVGRGEEEVGRGEEEVGEGKRGRERDDDPYISSSPLLQLFLKLLLFFLILLVFRYEEGGCTRPCICRLCNLEEKSLDSNQCPPSLLITCTLPPTHNYSGPVGRSIGATD